MTSRTTRLSMSVLGSSLRQPSATVSLTLSFIHLKPLLRYRDISCETNIVKKKADLKTYIGMCVQIVPHVYQIFRQFKQSSVT